MSVYEDVQDSELTWTPLRGANEKIGGRVGVVSCEIVGGLRHVDGWSTGRGHGVFNFDELPGRRLLLPVVTVAFPDYPSPDTMTYVMTIEDARTIARQLLQEADRADREIADPVRRKILRQAHELSKEESQKQAYGATRCAAEGCQRARSFFADGKGYCKKHADELGIRPHGKI